MNSDGRILIIDDEAGLRQMMARVLQRAGYDVTTAANGKDGITLASEQTFDLLYLDIRMPGLNGLEVLKIIHTESPDLPVVLFTAQPDLHSAVEALRRGATDYLLKPLKPQAVIDRTQTILANKQEASVPPPADALRGLGALCVPRQGGANIPRRRLAIALIAGS